MTESRQSALAAACGDQVSSWALGDTAFQQYPRTLSSLKQSALLFPLHSARQGQVQYPHCPVPCVPSLGPHDPRIFFMRMLHTLCKARAIIACSLSFSIPIRGSLLRPPFPGGSPVRSVEWRDFVAFLGPPNPEISFYRKPLSVMISQAAQVKPPVRWTTDRWTGAIGEGRCDAGWESGAQSRGAGCVELGRWSEGFSEDRAAHIKACSIQAGHRIWKVRRLLGDCGARMERQATWTLNIGDLVQNLAAFLKNYKNSWKGL